MWHLCHLSLGISQAQRGQGGVYSVRALLGEIREGTSETRPFQSPESRGWSSPGPGEPWDEWGWGWGSPAWQLLQHQDLLGPSPSWLRGGSWGGAGAARAPPGGLRGLGLLDRPGRLFLGQQEGEEPGAVEQWLGL